jgi:hypothetical protein
MKQPKQRVFRLPGGGFMFDANSIQILFLNRKKIQLAYPTGYPLAKVREWVNRSLEDLEQKAA